ncbi:hypothetical protein SK128_022527 [Halocaridina rubra]|uniref:Uncharacterized protein n=1 Tax=Halocaridina rubra TaxID=373956 RepID=A0AAN8ZZ69_HALRR
MTDIQLSSPWFVRKGIQPQCPAPTCLCLPPFEWGSIATTVTETSPLLVSTANVTRDSSLESEPGPSTSPDDSTPSTPVQVIQVQEQVPDSRREGGRLLSLDTFRG